MSDEENSLPNVPTRGKAPVFVDGLSSNKTYLVIGVRNGEDQYNAVGVRTYGEGFKLHFWPNAGVFNVKDGDCGLSLYDRPDGGRSRGAYQGAICDWDCLSQLLDHLAAYPGTSVAPKERVIQELQIGFTSSRHFTA